MYKIYIYGYMDIHSTGYTCRICVPRNFMSRKRRGKGKELCYRSMADVVVWVASGTYDFMSSGRPTCVVCR